MFQKFPKIKLTEALIKDLNA